MSTKKRRTLSEVESDIVRSVYQHRLLSTEQIAELHMPGADPQWVRRRLRRLAAGNQDSRAAFLDRISGRGFQSSRLWFTTEEGARAAETGDTVRRTYRMTPELAAGPLQAHTLAVNDVGLAFVAAARQLGDECGPFDWHHEMAHRMTNRGEPLGRSDTLIADAVLSYTVRQPGGDAVISRFIELDRGTMNASQVVYKLRAYARYFHFTPVPSQRRVAGWQAFYLAFPRVVVVLAGLPETRLQRRLQQVVDLCRIDHQLVEVSEQLRISITTLPMLQKQGPFGATFVQPHRPGAPVLVDLLGREPIRRVA